MGAVETSWADNFILVTLREDITRDMLAEILQVMDLSKNPKRYLAVIIDMVGVIHCEDYSLQEIVRSAQKLKQQKTHVFVVRLNQMMQSKIVRGGLTQTLLYKETADAALAELGIENKFKRVLDSEFIKPLVEIIVSKIKEKTGELPEAKKVLKGSDPDNFKGSAIATLGLVSTTFNGSVALFFEEKPFKLLTDKFKSSDPDEDPANQFLNEIFQEFKIRQEKKSMPIQQFIPIVIRGEGLNIREVVPDPLLVLQFHQPSGLFQLYVGLN